MKSKLLIVVALLILICFVSYYLVFTPSGSKIVADQVLAEYLPIEHFQYETVTGNLKSGMEFKNIEFNHIENLPEKSTLRIQRIKVQLTGLSLDGIQIEIENLRLLLPESDPIAVSGKIQGKALDLNIFSKGIYLEEILRISKTEDKLRGMSGTIANVDLYVTGSYQKPKIQGDVLIDEVRYKEVTLSNIPTYMDMIVDYKGGLRLFGDVIHQSGTSAARNTKLNLQESKLHFNGPTDNPSLNLKGTTTIERIKITLSVKGTKEKPEINVSSEPSLPRQSLLVMLATGKRMQGVEELMNQGVLSQELAGDFVDYFIFGGRGDAFAKRFGLSSLSLKVTTDSQGIGVKKNLSKKLGVGYDYEQKRTDQDGQKMIQKFESDYQVTDKVSVTAGREIEHEAGSVKTNEVGNVDDKIQLKYKKSF